MSEHDRAQSGGGIEGGAAGKAAAEAGSRIGRLPRLFSEMEDGLGTGGAEGGAAGGIPREAVGESLPPGESSGEGAVSGAGTQGEGVDGEEAEGAEVETDEPPPAPPLTGRHKGSPAKRLRAFEIRLGPAVAGMTGEERFQILDLWVRSQLPAREFGEIVRLSPYTLYAWKKRFDELGPAGLDEKARGKAPGSRLAEPTRRAIVLMKQTHPEWGCERIHLMLLRSEGFGASAGAVARVLREEGYEAEPVATEPHPAETHRFERARPNQLWQTDLFTFLLPKREGRRVYLVAFMDDFSRYLVGYGLHATSSGAMVREVFEGAIANYGAPEEVLTDNGTQYHTWRGKSAFTELCERRGIRQIVARPRHPQTLGKIERFWGSLWRECVQEAIFGSLDEGRRRIGLYIDHYNFQRPHQGIEGLVPADRYFGAASEVAATLRARVVANALDLAQHGMPRQSVYLTGRVGEETIALHGEAGRIVLTRGDGRREEVDLTAPGRRAEPGERLAVPEPVAGEVLGAGGARAGGADRSEGPSRPEEGGRS